MRDKEWSIFIKETIGGYTSVALSYTSSFAEAEDIVWGVYANLLERTYPREDLPFIGLRAIYNAGINLVKHKGIRRYKEIDTFDPPFYPPTEAKMDLGIILDTLSKLLPMREKEVFFSYLSGFKYKEIAEMDNVQIGTIKSHISRSRKKIRNEFTEYANKK